MYNSFSTYFQMNHTFNLFFQKFTGKFSFFKIPTKINALDFSLSHKIIFFFYQKKKKCASLFYLNFKLRSSWKTKKKIKIKIHFFLVSSTNKTAVRRRETIDYYTTKNTERHATSGNVYVRFFFFLFFNKIHSNSLHPIVIKITLYALYS